MNALGSFDIAIIGGGAAGIAASIKLKTLRPDLNLALFERDNELGGILLQCIHTGFGLSYFRKEMTGPEFVCKLLESPALKRIDIFLSTHVTGISAKKRLNVIGKRESCTFKFKHIVLATGSREIPFGNLAIPSSRPAGIFTAGEAQYLINRRGLMPGRRAVILGAGDIGLIMCRRFLFEGLDVAGVVEIQQNPAGMPRNVQTCVHDFDVPLFTNSTIVEVHGTQRVEAVTIAELDKNQCPLLSSARKIFCDTLLIAVGLLPEIDLALDLGAKRHGNMLKIDRLCRSSIPWISPCGNARSIHSIVDDACFEGEKIAAIIAEKLK